MSLSRFYTLANLYTLINLLVLSFVIYSGVHIFYTFAGSKLTQIETRRVNTQKYSRENSTQMRKVLGSEYPNTGRTRSQSPPIGVLE